MAMPVTARQHQQLNAALFSSNPPQYLIQAQQLQQQSRSPRAGANRPPGLHLMSFEGVELVHHNAATRELHQAEKLATEQHKNAFQFDTITPKSKMASPTAAGGASDNCKLFCKKKNLKPLQQIRKHPYELN